MAKSEGIVARKKSYATFDFVSMLTPRSHSFLHSNKPTFSDILKEEAKRNETRYFET
jgi:hypothetical protein